MSDELIQDQVMNELHKDPAFGKDTQEQKVEEKKEEAQKESPKEYNMRQMRERLEASERRAKDLEEQMKQRSAIPQQQTQSQESDDIQIGDEDLIEGKHLKKYVSSTIQKYERKLEEMERRSAEVAAENRLKAQYQDFDSVMNEENFKNLATLYPEDYRSVVSNPDIYSKGKTAYNMIKRYGIVENAYEDVDRRLSENKNKPRAAASISPQSSDTPLARVGDYDRRTLTEERKEQLRQQVAEAKMYGGR